jgi:hypothetical protein
MANLIIMSAYNHIHVLKNIRYWILNRYAIFIDQTTNRYIVARRLIFVEFPLLFFNIPFCISLSGMSKGNTSAKPPIVSW